MGRDQSIGLDIGTYSIKVTSLETGSNGKTLTSYNVKTLPIDIKSTQKEKMIRETLEEIALKPEAVNLSVSGPDVIVRFIDLPNMTKDQLVNALVFEAEKYIPFNVNEVILDSIILGAAGDPSQMRVLLAAVKKDHVENLAKMMDNMGMRINCIDIDPFAMFNAYLNSVKVEEEESSAFLLIGHSTTDILISIGSIPCFMRQIQIAGRDITVAISKALSVPEEKAEKIKKEQDKESADRISQAMSGVLDDLIRELQLSFGYFENRFNRSIKTVFSSGGQVYQDGVLDYLSKKLGIEIRTWDPLKGITLDGSISGKDIESVSGMLAVSIGLSLRG